jgi:hypothetical protein
MDSTENEIRLMVLVLLHQLLCIDSLSYCSSKVAEALCHLSSFLSYPDLSKFRFLSFWQLIWYCYAADQPFPHDDMLPGRFLGINEDSGDEFTFNVLPKGKTPRAVGIWKC